MNDIIPNQNCLSQLLLHISFGLIGGDVNEKLIFFVGGKKNGKSSLIELINLTFGEYFGVFKKQIFALKNPNVRNTNLLNLTNKNIMIGYCDNNTNINCNFIKFITKRYYAKFITLLKCNDLSNVDKYDNYLDMYIRIIHFPTEFVDIPTEPHQKKINESINLNFVNWTNDFMLLLISHYKQYIETDMLNAQQNVDIN